MKETAEDILNKVLGKNYPKGKNVILTYVESRLIYQAMEEYSLLKSKEAATLNPDKENFDKQLLKELAWKLDREVWAHVQNLSPSEEWSTSKAREATRELIAEYIGDYDKLNEKAHVLAKEAAYKAWDGCEIFKKYESTTAPNPFPDKETFMKELFK